MTKAEVTGLQSAISKFTVPASVPQEPVRAPERCEVCGSLFREEAQLIAHIESHFKEQSQPKIETEKCPKCPLRFAVAELVSHMQQDHFIY